MCGESTEETQQQNTQQQQQASSQTVTPTTTPADEELKQIQLQQLRELTPGQTALNKELGAFASGIFKGGEGLADPFASAIGGITDEMAGDISQQAVSDLGAGFQGQGILDSGVAAALAGRTAGDIRRNVAQFNSQNALQWAGLGLGGQAQMQGGALGQQGALSQTLAGLRPITTTGFGSGNQFGSGSSLTTRPNDYLTPAISGFSQGFGGAAGGEFFGK